MARPMTRDEVMGKPLGRHACGGGLFLMVGNRGRSWGYRFHLAGRQRDMGLGNALTISHKEAIKLRDEASVLKSRGIDPIEDRKQRVDAQRVAKESAKPRAVITFKTAAERFIAVNRDSWSNAKHQQQWSRSLEMHVHPHIGDLAVADVTRDHLVRCLRPIWLELKETAARLRGRIESVLAFAEVKGWRPEGSNPAALKPITIALGKQRRRPRRQPALPVDQMAEFMADLRARDSRSARALELLILCAVRSNEVLEATWDEFKIADDWRSGNWLIRGERMKGTSDRKYSHIVPLSPAALALLRKVYERRTGALVFGLSSAALEKMVDIMNGDRAKAGKPTYADPDQDNRAIVPHGFRSTFRDWAGDNTDADHETIEFALAHGISDKTEVAYRRTTAIEKRRKLMKQWAEFCSA